MSEFTNVNDLAGNIFSGFIQKATVKQHTRQSKSGKLSNVKQHEDSRQKKGQDKDLLSKIKDHYDVKEQDGNLIIKVKAGGDFPYIFNKKSNTLYQLFSSSVTEKAKQQKIKTVDNLDSALKIIQKRHNKATSYMGGWKKID